jgi:hypothetical protein
MIAPFSIDTYLPSFPAIESYYQVSRELLSTSMGAYLLAFFTNHTRLGDRLPIVLVDRKYRLSL